MPDKELTDDEKRDMTMRGFLRGLRIYVRGWRPRPHVVFGLMFGAVGVAYGGRFGQGFVLGVILSGGWEYAMRKGWIRAEKPASSPE